jgi:hypothetical protein
MGLSHGLGRPADAVPDVAGLSPGELRPVAGTAEEVELAADAAVITST